MGSRMFKTCQFSSFATQTTITGPTSTYRHFHDYFVTHLPSSSLHPDARSSAAGHHQLPRAASKPHTPKSPKDPSPTPVPLVGIARDTTVVRIPLRSAKHHFGVSVSRGTRPYNEDSYQAGVIELPAFAKRSPISLTRAPASSPLQAYRESQRTAREQEQQKQQREEKQGDGEITSAQGASGDPQVFYFGVFDGHGGTECSGFLRESLHEYIENAARDFGLNSSLTGAEEETKNLSSGQKSDSDIGGPGQREARDIRRVPQTPGKIATRPPLSTTAALPPATTSEKALQLKSALVKGWRDLVGGYFRRFKPEAFSISETNSTTIFTVLTYAFLRADYDFVSAQARKSDSDADPVLSDAPLNASDILDSPSQQIGGPKRFKGGSTCSVAMVSTPSPTPFWHPASPSTLVVAHVGDTRILLCKTSDGNALPVTMDHHPSSPGEGQRLRRYAGSFVTDSFGEERISGLANTRAFGDMQSKRLGVSAEPELRRIELAAAEYSFMVLVSDGVSGTLSDQEVVDIIKEARTPDQGAKDVVAFATEVSTEGDNATCLVIRLGGWERRSEGGLGSLGTREAREWRKQEATDPRSRRT